MSALHTMCPVTWDCDVGTVPTSYDVKISTLISRILQSIISFMCRNSFIEAHSVQAIYNDGEISTCGEIIEGYSVYSLQ